MHLHSHKQRGIIPQHRRLHSSHSIGRTICQCHDHTLKFSFLFQPPFPSTKFLFLFNHFLQQSSHSYSTIPFNIHQSKISTMPKATSTTCMRFMKVRVTHLKCNFNKWKCFTLKKERKFSINLWQFFPSMCTSPFIFFPSSSSWVRKWRAIHKSKDIQTRS